MAERILGPQGSKRRRRFLWVPMLVIAAVALFAIGSAQAVHDLGFQLDGDVSHNCPSALTLCSSSSQKDWADLFTVSDTATTETVSNSSAVTGAFTQATFTRDFESGSPCALDSVSTTFCTGDDTTFATGSKDTLDITQWECNHDNNVNSKIDIMNAYAAAYTDPGTGDKILYFGLEKNKDNGTNDVGFWFLQGNASCSAPTGHKPWTGAHTTGDVLVVSEFTNGGGVSNITAYRWVGGANPLVQIGTAGDCKGSLANDTMCATTNSGATPFNTTITTPWLTSDATLGVGTTQIVPPDFFEGGINLTKAFNSSGATAPSCFNTYIADTRSSNVTGSTLFDFARGRLGQCTTALTTTAGSTANGGVASPTSIGSGVVSSGTDTATLSITGTPAWAGTLTWYLCGPVTTDGCSNSGYQVTSRSVNQSSAATAFVSGSVNLTSAGRYCWTAHFEPDTATKNAGIDPKDDNGVGECFTVAAVQASLATSASCSASGSCIVGSTLSDTATLSNAASAPGTNGGNSTYSSIAATNGAAAPGSISWVAYGPDNCTTVALASTSRNVSGNGTYPTAAQTAVSFTPSSVGTYTFVAQFTSTSVNTIGTNASACPDTTNTENVTVLGTAASSSAQRWLPNDRVVLTTNGSSLHGTLTVSLYRGSFSGTAGNCTAGSATAISGQSYSFTPNGDASGTAYQTTNSTFFVGTKADGTAGGAAGSYFWLIHYVDSNLTDPTDRCETTSLTITD